MSLLQRGFATLAAAPKRVGLIFPGGGLFFWWQAGAIAGLAGKVDLASAPLVGASAGSLAATLAACDADIDRALSLAINLSDEAGVFERGPWGLYGIWGPIIHTWLDELLPDDAADRCRGRVSVLVREVSVASPYIRQLAVSDFTDKADLISSCMASVHVPFFLDRKMTTEFRGKRCVDGSLSLPLLPKPTYMMPTGFAGLPTIRVSPMRDPRMRKAYGRPSDFLRLSGEDSVREMMLWGQEYVTEGNLDLPE